MKATIIYGFVALVACCLGACQNSGQPTSAEEPTAVESDAGNVVTASLTDSAGNTLDLLFNHNAGTATLVLAGDTILLTQDTMASGIRYSNDEYIYAEHQGDVELTKNGEAVFSIDQ